MRTLLIHDDAPPHELRELVRAGSTEVREARRPDPAALRDVDRVVIWRDNAVTVDDRRLRWPEDRDELVMLFETGG
jgi:hypothetical protein